MSFTPDLVTNAQESEEMEFIAINEKAKGLFGSFENVQEKFNDIDPEKPETLSEYEKVLESHLGAIDNRMARKDVEFILNGDFNLNEAQGAMNSLLENPIQNSQKIVELRMHMNNARLQVTAARDYHHRIVYEIAGDKNKGQVLESVVSKFGCKRPPDITPLPKANSVAPVTTPVVK